MAAEWRTGNFARANDTKTIALESAKNICINLRDKSGEHQMQMVTALEEGGAARRADNAPACAWVMGVDLDVLFIDRHRHLAELMAGERSPLVPEPADGKNVDVVLSREAWAADPHINAGVVLVGKSTAGKAFLAEASAAYASHKDASCPEQRAIENWALSVSPSAQKSQWEEEGGSTRRKVGTLRQRTMNPSRGWVYGFNAPESLWDREPDSVIARWVGFKDAA